MTREEFYKLTDILDSEVLGNFMHGGEASEVIAQFEEAVEKSCILKEEPISDIDFEQELYKAFGQVKDFTLGMQIAKRFYEMGKQHQEPVSEDLEKVSDKYSEDIESSYLNDMFDRGDIMKAFNCGAKWQREQDQSTIELAEDHAMLAGMEKMKEQMMKEAVNGLVYAQRTNGEVMFRSNYVRKEGFEFGDKVKVIVIKED